MPDLPRSWRGVAVITLALAMVSFCPSPSRGGRVLRRFVPGDLEFEQPGVLACDMATGYLSSQEGKRVSIPDFEISLGATDNLEFDLEGEFAMAKSGSNELSFNKVAPDNLWAYSKYGLFSSDDPDADGSDIWTLGVQGGPKLPLAQGAQGVGFEGVMLLGYVVRQTHFVLNAGGLVDPASDPHSPRPQAVESGLSIDRPIDAANQWSAGVDLASVTFLSPDDDQFNTSATLTWSPSENLDLYATVTYGWLRGGDHYGVLFGMVPRLHLW
ncbi:MAG: hypothetical protein HY270_04690 [Deltaproteobacteria bacterium]|nr:hypothetical protein [Deltaproteobacteria bacterium]